MLSIGYEYVFGHIDYTIQLTAPFWNERELLTSLSLYLWYVLSKMQITAALAKTFNVSNSFFFIAEMYILTHTICVFIHTYMYICAYLSNIYLNNVCMYVNVATASPLYQLLALSNQHIHTYTYIQLSVVTRIVNKMIATTTHESSPTLSLSHSRKFGCTPPLFPHSVFWPSLLHPAKHMQILAIYFPFAVNVFLSAFSLVFIFVIYYFSLFLIYYILQFAGERLRFLMRLSNMWWFRQQCWHAWIRRVASRCDCLDSRHAVNTEKTKTNLK